MTATQTPHTTKATALDLDIARAQFEALKTPELRRKVRLLEQELNVGNAKNCFAHVTSAGGKRRRGRRAAQVIG